MAAAVRVFGKPITHGTPTQRALVAQNHQNADGKLDQVLQVTNQHQKAAAGAATVSTTFGRVYNATGATVTYVTAYNWEGHVVGRYPLNIENGQWAVFQHVGTHRPDRKGSVGALVYNINDCCDSMISWNNPWKRSQEGKNNAYCEMNDPGYFINCNCSWGAIHKSLLESGTKCQTSMDGYSTKMSIDEGGNAPSFTAIFNLEA